jgi:hypothetical protein
VNVDSILEECAWCGNLARLIVLGPNDDMLELSHTVCGQSTYLPIGD